jgi:hypothetical protein
MYLASAGGGRGEEVDREIGREGKEGGGQREGERVNGGQKERVRGRQSLGGVVGCVGASAVRRAAARQRPRNGEGERGEGGEAERRKVGECAEGKGGRKRGRGREGERGRGGGRRGGERNRVEIGERRRR